MSRNRQNHAQFQEPEGLKKRCVRHRSLDRASSLNFYSDSTRCLLHLKKENRNRSILEDI